MKEYVEHLKDVFEVLRRNKLFCSKPSKCFFYRTEIEFCGFIVCTSGVKTCPDKVQAIRNWPTPKNERDIKVS
jgi:hypothetical protein